MRIHIHAMNHVVQLVLDWYCYAKTVFYGTCYDDRI